VSHYGTIYNVIHLCYTEATSDPLSELSPYGVRA
jgi:hypothetical protein